MKKNALNLRVFAPHCQRGSTLLELMISISIGLVVIGAVFVVYLGTTATSRQSSSISRINEDAAIAMAMLGSSLRMAGYSPPRALYPPGSALVNGIKVVKADRNFMGAAIRGCDHGFSSAASVAFDALTCNPSASTAPAAFAVRYEGDEHNTIAVSGNPSDCLNQGIVKDTPSKYDGENYWLVESRFTVKTSPSSSTPELYCAGSGGTSPFTSPQPLMQFVENMVLTYGIAQDHTTGNVVRYATQEQVDALPGVVDARWGRVVSAKLCLVIRSDIRDQNGAGNYINCAGDSVASADGFVRRSFTSVYALRNRADFSSSF